MAAKEAWKVLQLHENVRRFYQKLDTFQLLDHLVLLVLFGQFNDCSHGLFRLKTGIRPPDFAKPGMQQDDLRKERHAKKRDDRVQNTQPSPWGKRSILGLLSLLQGLTSIS